ncbi:hypothetical protein Y032_0074g874 [Ancylostoma ceylanicum]|uniref:Uncharacterized protein n=1 Tax=Ancylostoma ceylanicum TaxID=53326 RepID=A0A016TWK5_9BILA|nr:hypothetical protein Y032_0074g874 [Ancylostoma ceylanicum]
MSPLPTNFCALHCFQVTQPQGDSVAKLALAYSVWKCLENSGLLFDLFYYMSKQFVCCFPNVRPKNCCSSSVLCYLHIVAAICFLLKVVINKR